MTEIIVRPAPLEDAEFLARGNARMALETEARTLEPDRLLAGVRAVFDDPRAWLLLMSSPTTSAPKRLIFAAT